MALTLYGTSQSRSTRVLWMLTELELEFEHVPLAWNDPRLKSPEFLRLNPAGAIPTLVDDGLALSESLAINLYLARRYGHGAFCPTNLAGEAQAWRWSLWAQGHLEPWVMRDALLADLRAAIAGQAAPVIAAALATLERAFEQGAWLVGERFTVADLNVAGVLSPSRTEHLDLTPYPAVADWLVRCYGRSAARMARATYR